MWASVTCSLYSRESLKTVVIFFISKIREPKHLSIDDEMGQSVRELVVQSMRMCFRNITWGIKEVLH